MKKRIKRHIDKQEFVKVYLVNENGDRLSYFNGFIFEQNEHFILLNETHDFFFDGFVVVRKSNISEIQRNDNDIFFEKIIEGEGIKETIFDRYNNLDFKLGTFPEMFEILKQNGESVIIEGIYNKNDTFQIGPINKVGKKRVFVDYFNSRGEFDLKPVSSKFKEITYFKIDSPYANIFHKYAKRVD